MRKFLCTAALLWAFGGLAQAETVRETLRAFGFFGLWSPECEMVVAPGNILRETTVDDSGRVTFTENSGKPHRPDVYVVMAARRAGPDVLVLRVEINGKTRQELTMARQPGRVRTMESQRLSDGRLVIKNGVVTGTGKETPWMVRCGQSRR